MDENTLNQMAQKRKLDEMEDEYNELEVEKVSVKKPRKMSEKTLKNNLEKKMNSLLSKDVNILSEEKLKVHALALRDALVQCQAMLIPPQKTDEEIEETCTTLKKVIIKDIKSKMVYVKGLKQASLHISVTHVVNVEVAVKLIGELNKSSVVTEQNIKDSALLGESIQKNIHSGCFGGGKGYLCRLDYDNNNLTFKYSKTTKKLKIDCDYSCT